MAVKTHPCRDRSTVDYAGEVGESGGVEDKDSVGEDDGGSEDGGCFEGRVGKRDGACCISMGPMRWSP